MIIEIVNPPGWPRPQGYSNGIIARGRTLYIAGQVAWDPLTQRFPGTRLADQVRAALANVLAVLRSAGGEPAHIVRMTWYLTSRADYLGQLEDIGAAWRALMGRNFPAMSVVEVTALMAAEARVEIEATAVLPD